MLLVVLDLKDASNLIHLNYQEVRGKMIGVSLIKELVKVAKNKGCYRITLFCKESLINFYSRNGFEVNNVVMKKYL